MTGFLGVLAARAVGAPVDLRLSPDQPQAAPGPARRAAGEEQRDSMLSGLEQTRFVDPSVESRQPITGETFGAGLMHQQSPAGPAAPSRRIDPPLPPPTPATESASTDSPPRQQERTDLSASAPRHDLRGRVDEQIQQVLEHLDSTASAPTPAQSGSSAAIGDSVDDVSPHDGGHETHRRAREAEALPATSFTNSTNSTNSTNEQARPGPGSRDQQVFGRPQSVIGTSPAVRRRGVPTRAPASRAETAPRIDVAALLGEEVYAALVERGDVPAQERPLVEPVGRPAAPPQPGSAIIRADGVLTRRRDPPPPLDHSPESTGPPTVNVHIDRVSVTRAAAPAPAPPTAAAPARSAVDHTAYLTRRRGHS